MLLYEINRRDLRAHGSAAAAIASGDYIPRDDSFIKSAFNYGNGTKKDMNRYMRDNSCFCVWIDSRTMKAVKGVQI